MSISFKVFKSTCLSLEKQSNLHDSKYLLNHILRLYNTYQEVVRLSRGKKGLSLFSIGAGGAYVEACLAKFMGFKITVLDFELAIDYNGEYYRGLGFNVVAADITKIDRFGDGSFDILLSLENIEHIPEPPSKYIAKFADILKYDGIFMVSTPNLGSIRHLSDIILMRPIMDTPEKTFAPVSFENEGVHRREYMPCEIVQALKILGFKNFSIKYTNWTTAFSSRRDFIYFIFGTIPRFKANMIVAAEKN